MIIFASILSFIDFFFRLMSLLAEFKHFSRTWNGQLKMGPENKTDGRMSQQNQNEEEDGQGQFRRGASADFVTFFSRF